MMPGSEKKGRKKEKEEGRGKGKLREREGEGGLRWMEGGKGKSFHPYFKSF